MAFIFLIKDESLKVIAVALSSSISAFYLLGANIKEFGFKKFFALISIKNLLIGYSCFDCFYDLTYFD